MQEIWMKNFKLGRGLTCVNSIPVPKHLERSAFTGFSDREGFLTDILQESIAPMSMSPIDIDAVAEAAAALAADMVVVEPMSMVGGCRNN